jgi:hypothetical protein
LSPVFATCNGLGYSIAGLEYSSQCFCDNYVRNEAALAASDSQCAMKCSGDNTEVCGGPGLISLYSTSRPAVAPVAAVKKTDLPQSWVYRGCYTDEDGNRDVGEPAVGGIKLEFFTDNTAEKCLTECYNRGFDAAGTEYSKQCCEYLCCRWFPCEYVY